MFTKPENSPSAVAVGAFVSSSAVEPVTLADGRAGLGFTQVEVPAVSTEQAGLNLVQVVAPHAQFGLQQVNVCLIAAFLHRQQHTCAQSS